MMMIVIVVVVVVIVPPVGEQARAARAEAKTSVMGVVVVDVGGEEGRGCEGGGLGLATWVPPCFFFHFRNGRMVRSKMKQNRL